MLRVEFLKYMAALAAMWKISPVVAKQIVETEISRQDFGNDFSWGVATSAYQVEGAWNIDGKGESIWDRYTQKQGNIKDGAEGKVANDFYHRYDSDLRLLKSLNFKNFRFSFSWPRLLPDGTGKVNGKGIDFYDRMIDTCLKLGIEPWAMLYHWDLPQKLEDKDGWTNRDIVGWFSEYADLCSRKFGDRIKHWMVLNEPGSYTTLGYLSGIHAPSRIGIGNYLSSVHHTCLCQAEGGRILRGNVPKGHIGTTFSCSSIEPEKETSLYLSAAKRLDVVFNRLFIEPSLGKGYPFEDLPFLEKMAPYIQEGDMEKLKFEFDFIGIQNYFRVIAKPFPIPYLWASRVKPEPDAEMTEMGWEVNPDGMYKIIKQFAKYPIKEMIITENGAAFPDQLVNGRIHDQQRINFYKRYLHNILKAKREGVNITGYFAWTFIDNFEWVEGFHPRFGLVHNDFNTQERIVKDSGYWFRDFLK
ncbi:MAG: GH1 family beta-glucosidase [Prolixibacteraceae bacterium]